MPDTPVDADGELPLGDHPEDEKIALADATHDEEKPANIIMAAAQGAQTGVKLAVAVGAMVLAFVALVALANGLLTGVGNLVGLPGLTFQGLLGMVFKPVMFLLNIPWHEAGAAGGFFGEKIVLNEFVAYIDRSEEHTSELQSLMRISYAVFCLKKKKKENNIQHQKIV